VIVRANAGITIAERGTEAARRRQEDLTMAGRLLVSVLEDEWTGLHYLAFKVTSCLAAS
jgi:hypothetical protein